MSRQFSALTIVCLASAATCADEAISSSTPTASVEKVYVVGSRNSGRSSSELAVPVDILDQTLIQSTGELELGRVLQRLAPSFNFSSSSISDGTDALRPATLRGLGPDQTLVLINGKRRHSASLLHVNTSVGRGTAGTDLNAIPSSAIKRIEILRDGAAAQYGSDALAGVINIVLKDEVDSEVILKAGGFEQGDGLTGDLAVGHTLIFDTGYLFTNFALRRRDHTNRAGDSGVCQYLQTCELANNMQVTSSSREINFNRQNFRIGDAQSEQVSLVLNGVRENFASEQYAFLTFSHRENESAGFFRRANEVSKNPTFGDGEAFYIDGFLPLINTELQDLSISLGHRSNWNEDTQLDVSITSGFNTMNYDVSNSVNASYAADLVSNNANASRIDVPTSAHAGQLALALTTINADFSAEYEFHSLAYGAELRIDNYKITAGDTYSYRDYDGIGNGAAGGIQVFPGFNPVNSVDESRSNLSGYIDSEWQIEPNFFVTGAIRADIFEDFGNTINGKISARRDINEKFAVRASLSTGFRAPSMQQLYFNNVSTQFNGTSSAQVGTFRNDSELARQIGIPELKEEKSLNISAGFTLNTAYSSLTADTYFIDISDRIVISEQLTPELQIQQLSDALLANGVNSAQFFVNAVDTETKGVDLVYQMRPEGFHNKLHVTVAGNWTDTEVTSVFAPNSLSELLPEQLFGAQAVSIIETWQPKSRLLTNLEYVLNDKSIALTFNRFGSYRIIDANQAQTFSAKWLTDVAFHWQVSDSTKISVGINNVFDVKPDKNKIGQFRAGTIVDNSANLVVDSPGVFNYSRRAAPFGFNGAFGFLQLQHVLSD